MRHFPFERQVSLPLEYKGVHLDCGYRLDFVVANLVVVELKAVDEIHPIHEAQLLTYLRLSERRLGLIINFNEPLLKDGIRRLVLNFRDDEQGFTAETRRRREFFEIGISTLRWYVPNLKHFLNIFLYLFSAPPRLCGE